MGISLDFGFGSPEVQSYKNCAKFVILQVKFVRSFVSSSVMCEIVRRFCGHQLGVLWWVEVHGGCGLMFSSH